MDEGRPLIKLALFGRPVKSSLSPSIHGMFAEQLGLDIEYRPIETGMENFPQALEEFRLAGGTGCNITLPLKRDAYRLASGCTKQVKQAQAANTLVHQTSGWLAHNTDGKGLIADLHSNGIEVTDRRVLILGAGGATAGILGSILALNPRELLLVNRNLDRARLLAERFNSLGNLEVIDWQGLTLQSGFNLVINATSLGHQDKAPALEAAVFAMEGVCYDLNYYKASQPLKELCKAFGQPYFDGLGMLIEQAAASFEIWTGQRPDSSAVIQALSDNHP